jgi:hypothetical protein
MKVRLTAPVLIIVLIGMLVLASDLASGTLEEAFPTHMPLLYIEPDNIIAFPGETVTISVRFFNLTTNIYQTNTKWDIHTRPPDLGPWSDDPVYNYSLGNLIGFDVQLGWDTSVLRFQSCVAKIPVEVYPDGVLHEPAQVLRDWVNETDGFPLPQPEASKSWLVCLSAGRQGFNGNGTVAEVTFEVLNTGSTSINITRSLLSDPRGDPIPHRYASCHISSEILPEHPSLVLLPLGMISTLLAALVHRRKHFT